VERSELSHLAHANHPIAAPLGDRTVRDLLQRGLRGRSRVVDLGCGDGTWLLRAVQMHPRLEALGVDISGAGFDRVRMQAGEAGVADRLVLHRGDARAFEPGGTTDAVLCVGATHAFGGLLPTLDAARGVLDDGDGVLLLGDGFWERTPDERALSALGAAVDDFEDLASTVARVQSAGWSVLHGHVSTVEEWDDYEWSWTGALEGWALAHPGHADAEQVRTTADAHRRAWLGGYRGTLGFVTLLLTPRTPE